jgi:two-component system, NtrC family, response regulator GlrR
VSTSGEAGTLKTQALVARANEIVFGRFRLQVTAGPEPGASCESTEQEISIGSSPQNQLVVKDRAVSRHHCSITATKAGFLLRDLGSTNGTALGGYRVEAAYLEPSSVITVGASQVRFELLDDEVHEPLSSEDRYSHALGRSAAMRRIFAVLPRIAASDSTVLIEGETGTGKGLLAEVIHLQSPRAKERLVVVDCSAIPPTLIEAELFGHAKGAFTGAQSARAGAFEAASGGTIFLDEIGELRLDMQPKLLRALEERVIRRIGSLDPVRLDVRILAATNRDLRREVNQGSFRADLYYRLNTVQLRVPPLRERKEDISLLAAHFYAQFAPSEAAEPPPSLLADLLLHPWPGNVRELRGAIERAVLFGDPTLWRESVLGAPEAPPPKSGEETVEIDPSRSFREAKELAVSRWERSFVQALVRAHGGNLSRAARAVRMDRNHLRELLQRHGVSTTDE